MANLQEGLRFWPALNTHGSAIVAEIRQAWSDLISRPETTEQACLSFIAENAGFFFRNTLKALTLVVSELRLGADHRIDFMQPSENYSRGPSYKLIEIESPNAAPYDSRGYPTRRLTDAIQQIHDWRSWIARYRVEAMELFPSAAWHHRGTAEFTYEIIIGRRTQADRYRGKLHEFAARNGVTIRSFDYLTDRLNEISGSPCSLHCDRGSSAELRILSRVTSNQLANPFVRALSDADWRFLVRFKHGGWMHHLLPSLAQDLPARLRASPWLAEFDRMWAALGEPERKRLYNFYMKLHPREAE